MEQGVAPKTEIRAFLIADVRGYTRFTVENGDEAAARLASRFAAVAREGVAAHGGDVIELRGDEVLAVFVSVRSAIRAAVNLQSRFTRETRDNPALPLVVGIGLDAGEAVPVESGYRGTSLNLAARLCGRAAPGEVLVSETVANIARKLDGIYYVDRGTVEMKGFADPVRVIAVEQADMVLKPPLAAGQHANVPVDLPVGGFLGALPSDTLVARVPEVEMLRHTVELVSQGEGQFVALLGEAGAGKTRLAQEATALALDRHFLIAAASSYEPQQSVPFYPCLELLTALYDAAPVLVRGEVPHRWPQLGRLLPQRSTGDESTFSGFSSREEQQQLFWSVADFLRAIAESMPVGLFLDDLHWADSSTLELMQYIAQHTRNCAVLVVTTYRDTEVRRNGPLDRLVLVLSRQRLLQRVPVARLDEHGTRSLLAATIDDADVPQDLANLVYRYTEGNPFFVQEISRALVERGDVFRRNGTWAWRSLDELGVPDTVRAVVDQRVAGLSDTTQDVLRASSVLGQTFTFDDVLALVDVDEDTVEKALEEAIAASIVREGSRDSYAFNHALMQSTMHADLPTRRRRRLHLRAGDIIERGDGDARAAEMEWHFTQGGEPARALPYAQLVGDRAESAFAHDDARHHYQIALDLAQILVHREAEAAIHEKLGGLYTAVIRYSEALHALERSAVMYRELGNWEAEARVAAQIGRVHVAGGSLSDGIHLLTAALHSLEGRPASARCRVLSSLARILYGEDAFEEALRHAIEARKLAEEANDSGVRAEAQVTQSSCLAMVGRWTEGLRVLEDAIQDAEVAGDLFSVCRGLQHAAGIYLLQGSLVRARQAMERAKDVGVRMDNRRQIATANCALAFFDHMAGRTDSAEELATQALEMMRSLGGLWLSILKVSALSLSLSQHEWETAPQPLREVLDLSETGSSLPALRQKRFEAEREMARGHAGQATRRLRIRLDRGEVPAQQGIGLELLLADLLTLSGEASAAQDMAEIGIDRARAEGLALRVAFWQSVKARALDALNDPAGGADAARAAQSVYQAMPYTFAAIAQNS